VRKKALLWCGLDIVTSSRIGEREHIQVHRKTRKAERDVSSLNWGETCMTAAFCIAGVWKMGAGKRKDQLQSN
jgi:hypothetical protein